MPAKFLVGSRRPRSLRSLSRAHISSQNVTSAQNYGIVKAGDGGNGGRGFDGTGAADKKDHAAIGSYTAGTSKGNAGNAGVIYSYGTNSIKPDSSANAIKSNAGKVGADGNTGWNGLNFHKYTHKDSDRYIYVNKFKGKYGKKFELYTMNYYPHGSSTEQAFKVYAKIGDNGHVDRSENEIAFCMKGNGQTKDQTISYDSNKAFYSSDNIYVSNYWTWLYDTSWDLYYRKGSYLDFYVFGGIVDGKISPWEG